MPEFAYPRFGGYSLADDEDEERMRRTAAQMQGLDPSTLPPIPQQQPSSLSALLPQRDPYLDAQWRAAEESALARSQAPEYGVGEAIRDFAPVAIGGALDIFLNKGAGLGALAGGAVEANARHEQMRRADQQAAAQQALAIRRQREQMGGGALDNAYRLAQMQRWDKLDAMQQAGIEARSRGQDQRDRSLDQADRAAGQRDRRLGQIEDTGLAEQRAAATTRGRIGAQLELEPQTTEAAARRATAVAEATTPEMIKRSDAAARAKAGAERDIAGEKTIGNVEIVDPKVWSTAAQSTKAFNDANDIARSKVQFEKAMNDMADIQARAGTQVMPSGDKAAYDTAQAAAIGSLTTLFQTGVINEAEYERYKQRIPASGVSAGSVVGGVTGKNVVGDQIAATRDTLSGIFDAGLSQYGLRGKTAGAPQQGGAMRLTGSRAEARTPVGGYASGGTVGAVPRMRTVTAPDGSTEQLMLTDEDAAFLESQGGKVR